jgi:hypothetical protein
MPLPKTHVRQLSTLFGYTSTQREAVTGQKWMPGFVVYLYLCKERDLASKPLIWLCF